MSSHSHKHTGNVTSFRKKGTETLNIRGTRIATQNAQLLTSTGSSTLDFFIGGGLAIGTVCLIEEDRFSTYSNVLLKYFLTEGVANGHHLFLSSGEKPSKEILSKLPSIKVPDVKPEHAQSAPMNDDLKIAWRYQSQSSTFASGIKASSQNHGYDLSKTLSEEILKTCHISTYDPSDFLKNPTEVSLNFLPYSYYHLLERIKDEIDSGGFQTSNKAPANVLRIGICSLGSPLFDTDAKCVQDKDLIRFLYLLKAILRKSFAVAMVTVPSYVIQNEVLKIRMQQTCDTVIGLESFVGSDKESNPLFKEFDGLLQVIKLPVLNTFMYPTLASDLAFKLKRKDFIIERLHLPPDFEDSQPDPNAFGCSGQPSKLDF
ncbi:hypothetical protein JTE90_024015 [Oedothorax gibbosus]|uniref:Elongator complex protein 4 n=1 Tax=Oedothorax gibbosus TaxID=931172 RepID=A0AAV6VC91_9ARAC|nr:hypothetical protein JTE90_024015 [Oedothorax gibbosus]